MTETCSRSCTIPASASCIRSDPASPSSTKPRSRAATQIPGRRYADFAVLRGDPSDGLPGLKGVGAVTAAAMIRRHGDIAGVLQQRTLRPADREYLEAAITVVQPVDDLPVALPPGRRGAYPTDAPALWALAARHDAEKSVERLLDALGRLTSQHP